MSIYKLEKSINQEVLAKKASEIIATNIDLVLDQKERCRIALSGGKTPTETYKFLGQEHLAWDRVDVMLGDERWVDSNNELSNTKMLYKTLFDSNFSSKATFHPIITTELSSPQQSADAYEKQLINVCGSNFPVLDLILLGLGDDGHTASLFPYSDSLNVQDKLVLVGKGKGTDRITLSAPLISSANKVIFLVSGASKQNALKRLIDPLENYQRTPAKLINTKNEILILADEEASRFI